MIPVSKADGHFVRWVIHTCFNDYNDLQKNSRQSVKEKNVSTNIHQMKEQVPFKKHQNF